MMDRNNTRSATTTSATLPAPTATSGQIYPFLLGQSLPAYSTSLEDGSQHKATQQLPSSNPRIHGDSHIPIIDSSSGEDGALAAGFDPGAAMIYANRGKPLHQEPELDGYDCESEEGVEVAEEHAKPATSRGSGSKRSRAAEVHNLSEKRRRSRINEKMKALQKLIPNSNKTDKASMLDEAIDYLKQLQLQVQMLTMRNGLTLNPPYMPPALQSLQIRYGSDSASSLMNIGMGMVSLDPTSSTSFALQNRVAAASSHQNLVPGGVSNISDPIASFALGSSQSQQGFFRLPSLANEGIYSEDNHHLNPSELIRSASLHFQGQQQVPNANHMDRLSPQELPSLDQSNHVNLQHFQQGLEVRPDYLRGEVKAEESGPLKG